MVSGKAKRTPPYTEVQARAWLSWLAQGMQQHGQTVFLIEQLQPSWLSTRGQRWVYIVTSRLVLGLIGGLTGGLAFVQSIRLEDGSSPGMLVGPFIGLCVGLFFGFVDALCLERTGKIVETKFASVLQQSAIYVLAIGMVSGLTLGFALAVKYEDVVAGLSGGLFFGLSFALIYGQRSNRQNLTKDIRTVEELSFSWGRSLKGACVGLVSGGALGIIFLNVRVFGLQDDPRIVLFFGLVLGLTGMILSGFTSRIVATKTTPGQGVWLSAKNAAFAGLISGLASALGLGLILKLIEFGGELFYGTIYGTFAGILIAVWYGGFDLIQHFILRCILYQNGYIPWKFVRFLDHAVDDLSFLQKVGGGYIFVHRFLLEHFAAMSKTTDLENRAGQPSHAR